jgi:hypothetical protein
MGRNSIELRQIGIKHHTLSANNVNRALNLDGGRNLSGRFLFRHVLNVQFRRPKGPYRRLETGSSDKGNQ